MWPFGPTNGTAWLSGRRARMLSIRKRKLSGIASENPTPTSEHASTARPDRQYGCAIGSSRRSVGQRRRLRVAGRRFEVAAPVPVGDGERHRVDAVEGVLVARPGLVEQPLVARQPVPVDQVARRTRVAAVDASAETRPADSATSSASGGSAPSWSSCRQCASASAWYAERPDCAAMCPASPSSQNRADGCPTPNPYASSARASSASAAIAGDSLPYAVQIVISRDCGPVAQDASSWTRRADRRLGGRQVGEVDVDRRQRVRVDVERAGDRSQRLGVPAG